ncbi:hypothetical protein TCAL_15879 [Tigriopus californicus]|uniref:Uncharacterized protein n=1 Tax=Tigriopus californicus TaxID=6832 RepID=A0A553NP74_TIGCA|nr:hypothetical protein TCAL_15879 [Tigriopus californicus]
MVTKAILIPPRSIEFVKSNYSTLNITWHPSRLRLMELLITMNSFWELKETDLNKLSERD